MKTSGVFIDKRLDLAGELVLWSHQGGNPVDRFAILDDDDLGTHSIVASVNMVMSNIGVGKRVRLVIEAVE
jgi:hypothetical protein